jgi:hypothetical protein
MRQRQLFVLFLFAVFLFEVWRWREADREATDPTGVVHVGLFQFVDPMYTHASIVRYLNGLSQGGPRTRLVDLAPWWDEERTRYGGHGQYLRLEIFGPWGKEVDLPPLPRPEDPFWLRPVYAWRQVRALANAARERGIDPDNLAVRVFVLYEREAGDTAAHSRGSEKGRVAITRVSLVEKNPAYALVSIAHELAHTLGARDLYTEPDYLAQHPEGFVEPLRDPLYPQRFAELMAVDLPVAPGKEREVVSLDEVRVGHQTAADMGWISQERARLFYAPTSLDAIDRLPGMERRAEHPPVGPPEVIGEQASPAGDPAGPVEELAPPAAD